MGRYCRFATKPLKKVKKANAFLKPKWVVVEMVPTLKVVTGKKNDDIYIQFYVTKKKHKISFER